MKKPVPLKSFRPSVSRTMLAADGDCSPNSSVSQGCWQTLPELMPINPIHLGLMRNGKVLVLSGSGNSTMDFDEHIYQAAVWDPSNPDPNTRMKVLPNLKYDLWCNGMAFLPDGRALIVGGTEQYDPFHGSAKASIFNPLTEQFIQVQSMQHGRWYATVTALGDGKLLAFSGLNETTGLANTLIEDYRIGTTGWTPHSNPASWSPIPLYPWLHLLPDGRIFYSGYTNDSRFYDPVTQTWSDPGIPTIFNQPFGRVYGSSVLLPLLAPNYTPRVMNLGGENNFDGNPKSLDPATNTTEVIDPSVASPAWTPGPNMSVPRVHMNAVLLPTGKLLALGGSTIGETPDAPGTGGYLADLIDPSVDPMTVASAGVAAFARLYHSMALLLPDATVLVVGSNPARDDYEDRMEIYSPAYLFASDGVGGSIPAVRPQILSAPSIIGYGATFDVEVDNAADILAGGSVVLMRPGSPTHAYDMEQKMLKLSIAAGSGGAITVTGPPATDANGANIAPPGYHMLFVLNGAGVPSVAKFLQLSLTPTNNPPVGSITSPATDVTILPGQQVTFAGSATDSDGTVASFSWLFPDAAPGESGAQNPGAVTFPSLGTYVVSLTVTDNSGANDPNPPTRTVTVASSIPATLAISKTGTGGGTVTSNPTGIDCGGDCNEVYNSGTLVTLTATADGGSVFTGWSGGSCSGTGNCIMTVNSDTTVTANFDTIPPAPTLAITKTGTGTGTVASNPAGIACGGDCTEDYNSGTLVTLTATADAGSVFTGWSGGSCSGTGDCATTVNSNTTITANFEVAPPPLVLATSPLPDAEVGVSYVAALVSSGVAPYTTEILKGKLPPGLSLDPSGNGMLIGTPEPALSVNFTVQVTQNGSAPAKGSFKVKVLKALGIATNILNAGTHGKSYNKTLRPRGGKAPYSWSLVGGSLPMGLNLNSDGVITGVIDGSAALGPYNLTVEVTDPIKATDPSSPPVQKNFTLNVK